MKMTTNHDWSIFGIDIYNKYHREGITDKELLEYIEYCWYLDNPEWVRRVVSGEYREIQHELRIA